MNTLRFKDKSNGCIDFFPNDENFKRYPFCIKIIHNVRYPEDYECQELTKKEFFKLMGYIMKFAEEYKFI